MKPHSFFPAAVAVRLLPIALACLLPVAVQAQASVPPIEYPPTDDRPAAPGAQYTPAAEAAKAAAGSSLNSPGNAVAPTRGSVNLGPRPAVVTVGGKAAGDGTRVLKAPAACTPKTNSLDCVAETGQAGQGANVSSRVRNSVIGEVGAGRAATEGAGAAKRGGPCTPQAGKLTCD
ncbi:MAG: hypothetical protein WAQ08_02300 [Aquabacterium sp.]|jgi:hypothetical protein|uniref:hypothetical protein n=1 Tax=Aquabacterium sp. TaxID=1872578 RepID=UPI003BAE4AB9